MNFQWHATVRSVTGSVKCAAGWQSRLRIGRTFFGEPASWFHV